MLHRDAIRGIEYLWVKKFNTNMGWCVAHSEIESLHYNAMDDDDDDMSGSFRDIHTHPHTTAIWNLKQASMQKNVKTWELSK